MIRFAYAPDLVEETVLLAERTTSISERRAFRRERDRLYERSDDDRREDDFHSLHLRWFVRLGLHHVVDQVVGERLDLTGRVGEGRVLRAWTRREEGADLLDRIVPGRTGMQPLLVLRLRPAILLEPEALRATLRHELTHVGDMLDPAFGYERTLPPSGDGPAGDHIVRDRFRVLWDVTIDGRLARAGLCSDPVRTARWQEFSATFSMLGDRRRDAFDDWFDRVQPTHGALAAFARASHGSDGTNPAQAGRCPLCRFPIASLDRHPGRLSAAAEAAIRREHSTWSIDQGLCSQCLDLYEARHEETRDVSRR
jgi:hypothetical protein